MYEYITLRSYQWRGLAVLLKMLDLITYCDTHGSGVKDACHFALEYELSTQSAMMGGSRNELEVEIEWKQGARVFKKVRLPR